MAREERDEERQHGERADEEPAVDGKPRLRLAPVGAHVLCEVARCAGGVDKESDDRDEQEHERRAVGLAAALPGDSPHAAEIHRREQAEQRRIGEPEAGEDADEEKTDPARAPAGACVGNQERRRDKRPCRVERERAQVGERLVDSRGRHEYNRRDNASHTRCSVGVLCKHFAADPLPHEERGQVVHGENRHDSAQRAEDVGAPEQPREYRHQRMSVHRSRVQTLPQRHQVRALAGIGARRHCAEVENRSYAAKRKRDQPVNSASVGILESCHRANPPRSS